MLLYLGENAIVFNTKDNTVDTKIKEVVHVFLFLLFFTKKKRCTDSNNIHFFLSNYMSHKHELNYRDQLSVRLP